MKTIFVLVAAAVVSIVVVYGFIGWVLWHFISKYW